MKMKQHLTYHWNDCGSNVGKLDTALMQCANKQLSVFACVLVFHCIVCLHDLLLQHQYHLTTTIHHSPFSLLAVWLTPPTANCWLSIFSNQNRWNFQINWYSTLYLPFHHNHGRSPHFTAARYSFCSIPHETASLAPNLWSAWLQNRHSDL